MHERHQEPGALADAREAYHLATQEIEALLNGEQDLIAGLANAVAVLKERRGFFWVGIYRLVGDDLVLGPFQGTPACSRIRLGSGVCGACAARGESILVPDVDAFPGHIACDSRSRSEIVVPLRDGRGVLRGVLDVDSDRAAAFDDGDRLALERVASSIAKLWPIDSSPAV